MVIIWSWVSPSSTLYHLPTSHSQWPRWDSGMLKMGHFQQIYNVSKTNGLCRRKQMLLFDNSCIKVMRTLHVSLLVHMRVLNVRLCETEQAVFAVRDWVRAGHWKQPAVCTHGQKGWREEKCFATPGQITFNVYSHSFLPSLSPSVPLVSDILPLWPSSYYPFHPSSRPLLLPSAQSYHTGSLFLANLSLIHYWDLFFFLEPQNEEKGTDLLNFWCSAWKM